MFPITLTAQAPSPRRNLKNWIWANCWVYCRKAWLLVLGAVLGFGGAVLASTVMTPVYEADVQVLISEAETTVTIPGSPMALLTGSGSEGASLANRMQIIERPVVLEAALSRLTENGEIWE